MAINVQLALYVRGYDTTCLCSVDISSSGRFRRRHEAFQEQEAKLSTNLQENLSGIRVVKAFARQQYAMDAFRRKELETVFSAVVIFLCCTHTFGP